MAKQPLRFLFCFAASLLLAGCVPAEVSSLTTATSTSAAAPSGSYSGDYYAKVDLTQTGDTLRGALATFLNNAAYSQPGYSTLKTTLPKCDLDPSGSGKMLSFYSRTPLAPVWDSNAWNREHVWPNSRGVGESGPGSDPHMIRPTAISENSSRGNSFYGLSTDGQCFDPATYNHPEYRGIAARIIFYTATRYWKTNGLELSDNPGDSTSLNTMGKLSRLLEWNTTYPVDPTETYRNEVLAKLYNVRNPFIDYPVLASHIWGK